MSKQQRDFESGIHYYVSKYLIEVGIAPEHMDTAMSIIMTIFNESIAVPGVEAHTVKDILVSCVAATTAHMEAFQDIIRRVKPESPGRTAPPEWWPEELL